MRKWARKKDRKREKTVDRFQIGCVLTFCDRSEGSTVKNSLCVCMREVLEITRNLGKANSHLDPTQTDLRIAPPPR